MSTFEWLLAVFGLGAATYAMRAGPILALADRAMPALLTKGLRNVAPAVLAALVVTLIADPDAANNGIALPEVAGLLSAGVATWFTKNLIATLGAGMAVFWFVLWLT